MQVGTAVTLYPRTGIVTSDISPGHACRECSPPGPSTCRSLLLGVNPSMIVMHHVMAETNAVQLRPCVCRMQPAWTRSAFMPAGTTITAQGTLIAGHIQLACICSCFDGEVSRPPLAVHIPWHAWARLQQSAELRQPLVKRHVAFCARAMQFLGQGLISNLRRGVGLD